jgi:outer membrane receptor protein involved in Fe transport
MGTLSWLFCACNPTAFQIRPAGFSTASIDSEFTDFVTTTAAYSDNAVPLVPHHLFGSTFGWMHPTYGRIDGSVRYVSQKYIDNANLFELDPFVVMDLKYTYRYKQLEFSIAAKNLFNEAYAEYGEPPGSSLYVPGSDAVVWPGDGRAFFATVTYRF